MANLNQYDLALAKQYQNLNIKTVPVLAWDFHHLYLDELKASFSDWNKLNSMASANKWKPLKWDLKDKLDQEVVVVTDAALKIVFASHNIIKMNGYEEQEILGKTPKMFHGAATCLKTSNEIRLAIQLGQPFEKTVLNYKKNGEIYHCLIKGFPVFNIKGKLSHFIAFEKAA